LVGVSTPKAKSTLCFFRLAKLKIAINVGQGVILDRSVFSDWVFAEKNRVDGTIDQQGFGETSFCVSSNRFSFRALRRSDYYMALRKQMLQNLPTPSITLYLDVSAETCFERVHNMRERVSGCLVGVLFACS
jgi:deoxyadenosine/deoxycytidine kinase